jgi:hypothetical protein
MSLRQNGTAGAYISKASSFPTSTSHTLMMWAKISTDRNDFSTFSELQGGSSELIMNT